jgi:RNA polymerase sigma-70 factor (ECF subfamily)
MAERMTPCNADGGGAAPESAAVDLTTLIVSHHAAVYRYAYRLCGCPTEAEDLTQQAFLVAHQKLAQLREAERACSWLLAIVRSSFLKSVRKARPEPMANVDWIVDDESGNTDGQEEIDPQALTTAVGEIPDEFRVVLLMFYFEELSYQEIAAELEIPIGTVMSRLSRAKGHLRRRLMTTDCKSRNERERTKPTAGGKQPVRAAAT